MTDLIQDFDPSPAGMNRFTESVVEQSALVWLESTGRQVRGSENGSGKLGSQLAYLSTDGIHSG